MTDKELNEAMTSLMRWFQSQELNPAQASTVMIRLMADIVATHETDTVELISAVGAFASGFAEAVKRARLEFKPVEK